MPKKIPELKTIEDYEKFKREIEMEQAQKYHWNVQQKHWKWITVLALIAILANALKPLWSK